MALPPQLSAFKIEKILATHNSQNQIYIAKPPLQFREKNHLQSGQLVAIKTFPLPSKSNPVTQYLYKCQMKAISALANKKHIVQIFDVIQNEKNGYCYIVMKYYPEGTLTKHLTKLRNQKKLNNFIILKLYRMILIGYQQLIDLLLLHRDIKPSNILIKSNGDPILIDFGYVEDILCPTKPIIKYNVGSPSYMAPEAYQKCLFSEKSDIWSLGILLYQMVTTKTLDYNFQSAASYFNQLKTPKTGLLNFDKISGQHSQLIRQLLKCSLQISTEKRATCRRLKYLIDKQLIDKLNMPMKIKALPSIQSPKIVPKSNFKISFMNTPSKQTSVKDNSTSQLSSSRQQPEFLIKSDYFGNYRSESKDLLSSARSECSFHPKNLDGETNKLLNSQKIDTNRNSIPIRVSFNSISHQINSNKIGNNKSTFEIINNRTSKAFEEWVKDGSKEATQAQHQKANKQKLLITIPSIKSVTPTRVSQPNFVFNNPEIKSSHQNQQQYKNYGFKSQNISSTFIKKNGYQNSKEASTANGETPAHMLTAFKKLRRNIVDKQKQTKSFESLDQAQFTKQKKTKGAPKVTFGF